MLSSLTTLGQSQSSKGVNKAREASDSIKPGRQPQDQLTISIEPAERATADESTCAVTRFAGSNLFILRDPRAGTPGFMLSLASRALLKSLRRLNIVYLDFDKAKGLQIVDQRLRTRSRSGRPCGRGFCG